MPCHYTDIQTANPPTRAFREPSAIHPKNDRTGDCCQLLQTPLIWHLPVAGQHVSVTLGRAPIADLTFDGTGLT